MHNNWNYKAEKFQIKAKRLFIIAIISMLPAVGIAILSIVFFSQDFAIWKGFLAIVCSFLFMGITFYGFVYRTSLFFCPNCGEVTYNKFSKEGEKIIECPKCPHKSIALLLQEVENYVRYHKLDYSEKLEEIYFASYNHWGWSSSSEYDDVLKMKWSRYILAWCGSDGVINKQIKQNGIYDYVAFLYKFATQEDMEQNKDLFSNGIHKALVRRKIKNVPKGVPFTWFLVEKVIETKTFPKELQCILDEHLEDKIITDELLGDFVLDKSIDVYERRIEEWLGKEIAMSVSADKDVKIEKELKLLKNVLENLEEWDSKARDYLAVENTDAYNENLDDDLDDEKPITKEEFVNRIFLESISVEDSENFELYYNDGETFGGHVLNVYINIKKGITIWDMHG